MNSLWMGLVWLALAATCLGDTTVNSNNKFAYGANIGWVNAEADGTNGMVLGEFFSSGYLYGSNIGWIHLGDGSPDNGTAYSNSNSTDYGVNTEGNGDLRGFAYGGNIGWIQFEPTGDPKVNLITGHLSGFAYGANVGWISLSNMQAHVQTDHLDAGPDMDGDGLPDAWELSQTNSLEVLGMGDSDGDGVLNRDEYVAGTHPLDGNSFLAIVDESLNVGLGEIDITWDSVVTRLYRVEQVEALTNGVGWVDSGLGDIPPDLGPTTTGKASFSSLPSEFYRVKAIQPLSP